ncbi:hypothetical protein JXB31_03120 [Candidatus Woesearchaeota archaeon]|nr:hypothetical protein [Candidatus Woesearchaeota archaeon]
MFWIPVSLIIAWIFFWIARTMRILNDGEFSYRKNKVCRRDERPMLFHAEFFMSGLWSVAGLAVLFVFLSQFV